MLRDASQDARIRHDFLDTYSGPWSEADIWDRFPNEVTGYYVMAEG